VPAYQIGPLQRAMRRTGERERYAQDVADGIKLLDGAIPK
jgi:hypothetical protein